MGGPDTSQSDGGYASDIHDFRELLRTRDREGLESALASPDLYRLACDDERYMSIAMQGISALAWDEPAEASEHLAHFDTKRAREHVGSDARRAARALLAALEWRQLATHTTLSMAQMEPLRDFLQYQPALCSDPEHGADMLADMRAHPQRYLDFFEALAKHGHGLPEWILSLRAQPVEAEGPLDGLGEDEIAALSEAVVELRESLASGPSRYLLGASVLATMVFLPNALGVLIALLLVAGYFTLGERKSYDQIVRPRLIALAIDHGVGSQAVVTWIYKLRRQAGRMSHFDIKIENDRALDLMAAVAACAKNGGAAGENTTRRNGAAAGKSDVKENPSV